MVCSSQLHNYQKLTKHDKFSPTEKKIKARINRLPNKEVKILFNRKEI